MQTLSDGLKESGVPDRQARIFKLFPELLFGFSVPHLEEMLDRVDCPNCTRIREDVGELEQIRMCRGQRVDFTCNSVRERNHQLGWVYSLLGKIPVFHRWMPKPKPDPDCTKEPWYVNMTCKIHELGSSVELLIAQDSTHWDGKLDREISLKLLARHLRRESYVIVSS